MYQLWWIKKAQLSSLIQSCIVQLPPARTIAPSDQLNWNILRLYCIAQTTNCLYWPDSISAGINSCLICVIQLHSFQYSFIRVYLLRCNYYNKRCACCTHPSRERNIPLVSLGLAGYHFKTQDKGNKKLNVTICIRNKNRTLVISLGTLVVSHSQLRWLMVHVLTATIQPGWLTVVEQNLK